MLLTIGNVAADDRKMMQLTTQYNCHTCHAECKRLVGPGYTEIAK
jgi:cytochrome c551/c552